MSSPQDCMAAFVAAMIGRDMDTAMALLTNDAVFFYSNGTSLRGKDAFAAVMTANWKLVENYRYTTHDPAWVAQSESAAAVVYGFSWSGIVGGKAASGTGRGTRVFRLDQARWRISHEHLSQGPA